MKFFHIADLHIGKRIFQTDLSDDQEYILDQIAALAEEHRPQAIIVSGDVYDRQSPPAGACGLLDGFINKIAGMGIKLMAISGNHDSPERLGFCSELLRLGGVYIASSPQRITLCDEYGGVEFCLLPYTRLYGSGEGTITQAVKEDIAAVRPENGARSVAVAHQFVTACGKAELSDSEGASVGGVDNVDYSVYDGFDYVALGHLHTPQSVGRETVRYAGSPLKYSFSEAFRQKSITLVTLGAKNDISIELLPLAPKRELRVIKGELKALIAAAPEGGSVDYIKAVLTGDDTAEPMRRLKIAYPNALCLEFKSRSDALERLDDMPRQDFADKLFEDFYQYVTGEALGGGDKELVRDMLDELRRESDETD